MKSRNVSKGMRGILLIAALALFFVSSLLSLAQRNVSSAAAVARQSSSRVTPTAFSKPDLVRRYQQMITPEALGARLYFLASDFFEGRETGARGQKLAAQYLASQYRLLGLQPKGTVKKTDPLSPAAYFQPFTLFRRTPKETRLEVVVNGSKVASSKFSAETHDDSSYFLTGSATDAKGGVVFAGYGIADNSIGYNDFAALKAQGISIDGKWVMILADEPLADAKTSLLPTPERKPTKWSATVIPKRKAIMEAGRPAGVLVVRAASPLMQGTFADEAAAASLSAQRVGTLALGQTTFPPAYAISSKLADQILSASGQTIDGLRQKINQSLKPTVFDVSGAQVNTTVEASKGIETENVLAFIEGSDPKLKDEVVVITSHYDHLGLNPALKGDQIFNGAADDASGAVATLEIAQAFMKAKRDGLGPRRSILFINFSGEEKGTLGSAYYANQEPVIPLEKTIANINMDGVGGIDAKHPQKSRNYIYVIGSENLSQQIMEINRRVKEVTDIKLELTPGQNFGSDHRSFQAQLVPFIYFSTGLTEHYHQPSDEPATIDYEHLARVVQLVFGTAWQVANQDERPPTVDRSKMKLLGYVCPPCAFECDTTVYAHPGECPVCGMNLTPKYSVADGSAKESKAARENNSSRENKAAQALQLHDLKIGKGRTLIGG